MKRLWVEGPSDISAEVKGWVIEDKVAPNTTDLSLSVLLPQDVTDSISPTKPHHGPRRKCDSVVSDWELF